MALTKCPECGKDVSSKAAACPNCGFPVGGTAREVVPRMVPPLPLNGPTPPPPRSATDSKANKDKMKKDWLGWAGCLAIVVAIMVIIGSFIGDNTQKLSKAEWKTKLSQNARMLGGGGIYMAKDDFVKLMGTPDRTQSLNGEAYWYYKCKDGTIQVEANEGMISRGVVIGHVNDY